MTSTTTNFCLTEKVPIEKAKYLYDLTFKEFMALGNRYKTEEERKDNWNKVVKYSADVLKHNGEVERDYYYSKNMMTSGRLFSNGVQNIAREIRGFLMSHTTDIDM